MKLPIIGDISACPVCREIQRDPRASNIEICDWRRRAEGNTHLAGAWDSREVQVGRVMHAHQQIDEENQRLRVRIAQYDKFIDRTFRASLVGMVLALVMVIMTLISLSSSCFTTHAHGDLRIQPGDLGVESTLEGALGSQVVLEGLLVALLA